MTGTWFHLAARFFDVVAARPLGPSEELELASWLSPGELALFTAQGHADQRHGYECGRDVAGLLPDRPDLIRSATLHDIGKRHARLGAIGRVTATMANRLGLPLRGRFASYARHGELAADELEEIGAPTVVVEYARHHHGSRPATFPLADWTILEDADHARLPVSRRDAGYAVPDQTP